MAARPGSALLLATLMLTVGFAAVPTGAIGQLDAPDTPLAGAAPSGANAVRFEQNLGQTDPSVLFLSRAAGVTLFFTQAEIVMVVAAPSPPADPGRAFDAPLLAGQRALPEAPEQSIVRLAFAGADLMPSVTASGELPGIANYYRGNEPADWVTNVPSFAQIVYHAVYPGIDIAFYGTADGRIEHDFIVAPGVDPSVIRMTIDGAQPSLSGAGALLLATDVGTVGFDAPVLYQQVAGANVPVEGRFALDSTGGVRFDVGAYDAGQTLVIDPVLAYSTYLGGSHIDDATGAAVDPSGNALVSGATLSVDFPTLNAQQSIKKGDFDAFVTKLSPTGRPIYSTYLGGSQFDAATDIAVDASGIAHVTGFTDSSNFPTMNAYQATKKQGADVVLAKLSSTGSLTYSTYIGGDSDDYAYGVAVDPSANVYVTGRTSSSNFPTVNSIQPQGGFSADGFLLEMSSGGGLLFSTYLGGTDLEQGSSVAVDPNGDVYVAGFTFSTDFPVLNAYQGTNHGGLDGYVAKFSGGVLVYSTYLGGTNWEYVTSIAADASGNAIVVGFTSSADFPTFNAFRTTYASGEAVVSKFSSTGSLLYSTFLGGSAGEDAYGVAVDPSGNAYVTGATSSTDFPIINQVQTTMNGVADAFVSKLSPAGILVYSTYVGGAKSDYGMAIAVDANGIAFVTGSTYSTDFPAVDACQPTQHGAPDAFVLKIAYVAGTPTGCLIGTLMTDLPTYGAQDALVNGVHGIYHLATSTGQPVVGASVTVTVVRDLDGATQVLSSTTNINGNYGFSVSTGFRLPGTYHLIGTVTTPGLEEGAANWVYTVS